MTSNARPAARAWPEATARALDRLFGGVRPGALAVALVGNLLIAALSLSPAVARAIGRAGSDSLFTLAPHQRVVVGLISALLIFLLFAGLLVKTRWLLRRFGTSGQGRALVVLLLDAGLTLAVFVVALSLAPQVYYGYYVQIFPSLTYKWVLQPLPSPSALGALLAPPQALSLAELLKALSLRACLMISAWPLLIGAAGYIWFRLPRRPGPWAFAALSGLIAALAFGALAGLSSPP
ncbi:MAG: hypothetical protein AAF495_23305 [Pseudomonadota bacterium]